VTAIAAIAAIAAIGEIVGTAEIVEIAVIAAIAVMAAVSRIGGTDDGTAVAVDAARVATSRKAKVAAVVEAADNRSNSSRHRSPRRPIRADGSTLRAMRASFAARRTAISPRMAMPTSRRS
jgi:hypothetical protein